MRRDFLKGIGLVYEDRDLIVIDKPPGLLTMASETEREKTAYRILTDYVKKGCAKSHNRVFIVHRLDRDTSGLVVFAKSERAKRALQEGWDKTAKRYLAVVHGRCARKSATITSYLAENTAHVVYTTRNKAQGKLSTTVYTVIKEGRKMSLLDIDLVTGRKNQIRVHLAGEGHPVVGDKKYGRPDDGYRRLALHARSLSIIHPHTGERLAFETEIPAYFANLVS